MVASGINFPTSPRPTLSRLNDMISLEDYVGREP